jgi:hypothetical protein
LEQEAVGPALRKKRFALLALGTLLLCGERRPASDTAALDRQPYTWLRCSFLSTAPRSRSIVMRFIQAEVLLFERDGMRLHRWNDASQVLEVDEDTGERTSYPPGWIWKTGSGTTRFEAGLLNLSYNWPTTEWPFDRVGSQHCEVRNSLADALAHRMQGLSYDTDAEIDDDTERQARELPPYRDLTQYVARPLVPPYACPPGAACRTAE